MTHPEAARPRQIVPPKQYAGSAGRVAASLRDRIVSGQVTPGTRIREEAVSAEFSAGRYTVRTAIRDLVAAGLLVHEPNRGARVPELSASRIQEVWEFREVLEVGALRAALGREVDLQPVLEATNALLRLPSATEWLISVRAHQAIHLEIVRLSGNDRLVETYVAGIDELEWVTSTARENFDLAVLQQHHRVLADAFTDDAFTNAEYATSALEADIRSGLAAVLSAANVHRDVED